MPRAKTWGLGLCLMLVLFSRFSWCLPVKAEPNTKAPMPEKESPDAESNPALNQTLQQAINLPSLPLRQVKPPETIAPKSPVRSQEPIAASVRIQRKLPVQHP
jgi:hypothetical protein